jgi:hypothetical protein
MYTARLEALSLLTSTQEAKTGRERRPTYARRLSALLSSSPRITYPSYCRDTNSSFLPWWCRPIRELLSGNSLPDRDMSNGNSDREDSSVGSTLVS